MVDDVSCNEILLLNVQVFGFCCCEHDIDVAVEVKSVLDIVVVNVEVVEQDEILLVVEMFDTVELHVVVVDDWCDGKGYWRPFNDEIEEAEDGFGLL